MRAYCFRFRERDPCDKNWGMSVVIEVDPSIPMSVDAIAAHVVVRAARALRATDLILAGKKPAWCRTS